MADGELRLTGRDPAEHDLHRVLLGAQRAYSGTNDYYWRTASPGPYGDGLVDAGPLHAVKSTDGTGASVNGVFNYGSSGFPSSSFKNTNYWVDVNFADHAAAGPGDRASSPPRAA